LEKPKLDIRVTLTGKVKDRFLEIKEAEGLKNDTEVLRYIITEYHRTQCIAKKLGA
jgi:hypothetical protein